MHTPLRILRRDSNANGGKLIATAAPQTTKNVARAPSNPIATPL